MKEFLVDGYGCAWPEVADDEDEPKSPPLKSALVLGADATRRRKRAALEPAPPLLDEDEWPAGLLAMRKLLCVAPAVCGERPGSDGEPLRCLPRCERDSERYFSALCPTLVVRTFSLPPPAAPLLLRALAAGEGILPEVVPGVPTGPADAAAAPCEPKYPSLAEAAVELAYPLGDGVTPGVDPLALLEYSAPWKAGEACAAAVKMSEEASGPAPMAGEAGADGESVPEWACEFLRDSLPVKRFQGLAPGEGSAWWLWASEGDEVGSIAAKRAAGVWPGPYVHRAAGWAPLPAA